MSDPSTEAWREALAESNTDLLAVVARMDRLREQLARVMVERDDALALVASCARSSWIVARDGGRDCERCEQEIRRGEAYEIQPGTGGLLAHIHCPRGGA